MEKYPAKDGLYDYWPAKSDSVFKLFHSFSVLFFEETAFEAFFQLAFWKAFVSSRSSGE